MRVFKAESLSIISILFALPGLDASNFSFALKLACEDEGLIYYMFFEFVLKIELSESTL